MIQIQNISEKKIQGLQSFYDLKNDVEHHNYLDGSKTWHKNGQFHRDNDLPAAFYSDGTKFWYRNGKRHRDNDLPAVIYPDGTKIWYQNGKRHREEINQPL